MGNDSRASVKENEIGSLTTAGKPWKSHLTFTRILTAAILSVLSFLGFAHYDLGHLGFIAVFVLAVSIWVLGFICGVKAESYESRTEPNELPGEDESFTGGMQDEIGDPLRIEAVDTHEASPFKPGMVLKDGSGRPTDAALEIIRNWGCTHYNDLMNFVSSLWQTPGSVSVLNEGLDYTHVLTLEENDVNEAILDALNDNDEFWYTCWRSSDSKGRFAFEVRPNGKETFH